jgi:hypothetical protein
MTAEVVSQLVSVLQFKADTRPIRAWEHVLDDLSRKLKLLERQFANSKLGQKLSPSLGSAKQTKEQFQAALQASKLQLITAKAQAGIEQQQAKAAAQKSKAAAVEAKTQAAQRKFSLQHEQQMLKLQQERMRAQATQSRTQAAMLRAQASQAVAEAKLAKITANAKNSASGSRWGSRFSGISRAMAPVASMPRPVGMSFDIGGLSRLGGVAGGAAAGIAGLATAAAAAGYALKQFANQAVEAGAAQKMRTAQFTALTEGTDSTPKAAESKFRDLANYLGLSIKDTTDPWLMVV